jgi:hypothetical protein
MEFFFFFFFQLQAMSLGVQLSKLLLALARRVVLGFGPPWDPWPYFRSFQILPDEMGPLLRREVLPGY